MGSERDELKNLLNEVRGYLEYVVENLDFLLPDKKDLHSLIRGAWSEISPLFDKLIGKIYEVSEDEFRYVGLTGMQLELKLQQWYWQRTRVEEAIKTGDKSKIRSALSKAFNFIERILESLKSVIPRFDAIDEFKHTVADMLVD